MKQLEILTLSMTSVITFSGQAHRIIKIRPDPSNSIWDCRLREM